MTRSPSPGRQLLTDLAFTAALLIVANLLVLALDWSLFWTLTGVFVIGYSLKALVRYTRSRRAAENSRSPAPTA